MVPATPGQVLIRRAAVLGSPIDHSLSPVLHRAAYRALGLADWRYDRFEVDESGLAQFVTELGPEWAGLSLTMPLKEQALVVAEQCDPVALQTGVVNTLVPTAGGWHGYNTDVYGVAAALADAGVGSALVPASALILGSGATARSVLAALAAIGVSKVTFAVRKDPRTSTLAQANDHGVDASVVPLGEAAGMAGRFPLVISTLPQAGADEFAAELANDRAGAVSPGPPGGEGVRPIWMDVVYTGWPTPFASAAQQAGARVVSGLEMLIHQAVRQVELMTGQRPPIAAVQQAGHAALVSGEA